MKTHVELKQREWTHFTRAHERRKSLLQVNLLFTFQIWDSKSGTDIIKWQAHDNDAEVTALELIDIKRAAEVNERSSTPPPPSPSSRNRPQGQPGGDQPQSSRFYITFVSTSSDGTARVWRLLFDPHSSASIAADAVKRRSRHFSGNNAMPAVQSSGLENPAFEDSTGPRPMSWAPDFSKSRAGSVSSLSSCGSISLALPMTPSRCASPVPGYPLALNEPLHLSWFSAHSTRDNVS